MKHFLLLIFLITSSANAKTPTWVDPATAKAENAKFQYIGEYKSKTTDHFFQVTLLKNDTFHITTFQRALPGRGWDKRTTALTRIIPHDLIEEFVKNWERIEYQSPTLGKKAPKNATLTMPSGFDNVKDGILSAGGKTTKEVGSFKMHLEFMLPFKPHRNPSNQDKGNSGIYIYNNYEIQVIDTFGLNYSAEEFKFKTESKKTQWCGCLYKMKIADVNMCMPPLTWQTYDIEFTAPIFEGRKKVKNARLTLYHNGVKIHDDVELKKGTGAGAMRPQLAKGHVYFQNHGNPTVYRNVWIVETNN